MLEPTLGYVRVEGLDHRMHIQDVRKILGFCPQYGKKKRSNRERETIFIFVLDILYNELSVEEHLELIGKVLIKREHIQLVRSRTKRKLCEEYVNVYYLLL
jgi:ABC-type multidrug transport system ATPase subunit